MATKKYLRKHRKTRQKKSTYRKNNKKNNKKNKRTVRKFRRVGGGKEMDRLDKMYRMKEDASKVHSPISIIQGYNNAIDKIKSSDAYIQEEKEFKEERDKERNEWEQLFRDDLTSKIP